MTNDNEQTVEHNGITYRLRIEQDDNCDNPFDNDEGLGLFYSGHRHSGQREEARAIIERYLAGEEPDAVLLSVYSHSGEHWSVKGELPATMQCPWDSADIAGVWMPNKVLLEELKGLDEKARRLRCVEFARQAMSVLNQYYAGDVWGYVIEKKETCDKCQHTEWEHMDSCWGFYGHETCEEEGKSALSYYTKDAA